MGDEGGKEMVVMMVSHISVQVVVDELVIVVVVDGVEDDDGKTVFYLVSVFLYQHLAHARERLTTVLTIVGVMQMVLGWTVTFWPPWAMLMDGHEVRMAARSIRQPLASSCTSRLAISPPAPAGGGDDMSMGWGV